MKPVALRLTSTFCVFAMLVCGCGKQAAENAAPPSSIPALAPAAQAAGEDAAGEDAADTVLVTVNGKTLTRSMAADQIRQIAARQRVPPQMLDAFMAREGARLEKQVIRLFVDRTLLESEAERLAIPVSKEDVDAVVAKLNAGLPQGMTVDQALAAQGMDMDQLRKEIEGDERVRKLYESATESAEPVTTAQIETFYGQNGELFKTKETVDARHILVACEEHADAEAHATAKAEAEAIRKQLEEGADFAELAAAKSACPSKKRGGSLPPAERGQMAPPFEEAAFSQPIGEVGPVVKTEFGYHVILVTGKTPAGVRSLEEASEDIRQRLTAQQRDKLLSAYIDTLREKADIAYPEQDPEPKL